MSSRSTWWFLDLFVVALYAAVAGAALYLGVVDGSLQIALAAPLVVFLPGYALVSALYPARASDLDEPSAGLRTPLPQRRDPDGVERIALAVAASVAIVPLLWVGTDLLPGGIIFEYVLASVCAFTVLFALVGLATRWRTAPEHRFAASGVNVLFTANADGYGRRSDGGTTLFNAAVVVSLLLVVSTVGYAVVSPPATEEFTEFYADIDDIDGDTQTPYPDQFAPGEQQSVPTYIENKAGEQKQYTVVAVLQNVENTSDGYRVQDQQVAGETTATVGAGERQSVDVPVEPSMTGDDLRLYLLLFEGDPPAEPSASDTDVAIRLWVSVGESPPDDGQSDGDDSQESDGGQDDENDGDGQNDGDENQEGDGQGDGNDGNQGNDDAGDGQDDGDDNDGGDGNDGDQQTTTATDGETTTEAGTATTTDDGGVLARDRPGK